MHWYHTNIEQQTHDNTNFRKVLYTGKHTQLVLMSLQPEEEIGLEVHHDNDQFFRFESGQWKAIIDGHEYDLHDGVAIIIPAGAEHNIINISTTDPLQMYTLYSPPHHRDGIIHATKAQAEQDDEDFDGRTTE